MKEPRGRDLVDLDWIAQRLWSNGLEDMALFWYGDALAMQGAHRLSCASTTSYANSHDRHAMHDTLQLARRTLLQVSKGSLKTVSSGYGV
jgi:hypothetical protein